jgi:DNA-binding NtrC family response regulator
VGRLAASDLPALFVGEEGVGKRLLAATLHARSRHARRALVRVSCEAVSDAVLEAALFGADGADGRSGALEAADGGALLLEHVEALPTSLEPRLTHALEYGQTYRVGSTTPRRVHVRLVATARHRQTSFVERVLVGRLASVVVDVPPLRARTGDVEALARGFAGARELAPEAIEALRAHPWPGNVRELRATVERTLHTATARVVGAEDLDLPPLPTTPPPALRAEVERLERERIEAALAAHGGNRSRAARALGIARNTLLTRLRSYGL